MLNALEGGGVLEGGDGRGGTMLVLRCGWMYPYRSVVDVDVDILLGRSRC